MVKTQIFPLITAPQNFGKQSPCLEIVLLWKVAASTLHFSTPIGGLTQEIRWFEFCTFGLALCMQTHSWSVSFSSNDNNGWCIRRLLKLCVLTLQSNQRSITEISCWWFDKLSRKENNRVENLLAWRRSSQNNVEDQEVVIKVPRTVLENFLKVKVVVELEGV